MRTVGLVTFHRANNYGVCLQAFATLKYLEKLGYDAEIIDYTNTYEQRIQKWTYKEGGRTSGYITSLAKNILLGKKYYYRKGFSNIEKIYRLSNKRYISISELVGLHYDILIVGSDQVWNPKITNGIDEAFLLQFGCAKKRISIASSAGSTVFTPEDEEKFRMALKNFFAVSVREQFAKDMVEELIDKPVKVLLDPTLLLNRQEWIDCMGSKSVMNSDGKYILTYFVSPNKGEYQKTVKEYAKKYNCPVWSIQYGYYKWDCTDKVIVGATLYDFIKLIDCASLVLTDSLHGTAFSINLGREFVAFQHKHNPVRVKALLEKVELMERLAPDINENLKLIDYHTVHKKLDILRHDSAKWIEKALVGTNE